MATAKKNAAGPATKGLKIVSRREGGFRRGGRFFSFEGETVPLSDLSKDEVELIKSEPQLVVVEVDIAAEG